MESIVDTLVSLNWTFFRIMFLPKRGTAFFFFALFLFIHLFILFIWMIFFWSQITHNHFLDAHPALAWSLPTIGKGSEQVLKWFRLSDES